MGVDALLVRVLSLLELLFRPSILFYPRVSPIGAQIRFSLLRSAKSFESPPRPQPRILKSARCWVCSDIDLAGSHQLPSRDRQRTPMFHIDAAGKNATAMYSLPCWDSLRWSSGRAPKKTKRSGLRLLFIPPLIISGATKKQTLSSEPDYEREILDVKSYSCRVSRRQNPRFQTRTFLSSGGPASIARVSLSNDSSTAGELDSLSAAVS